MQIQVAPRASRRAADIELSANHTEPAKNPLQRGARLDLTFDEDRRRTLEGEALGEWWPRTACNCCAFWSALPDTHHRRGRSQRHSSRAGPITTLDVDVPRVSDRAKFDQRGALRRGGALPRQRARARPAALPSVRRENGPAACAHGPARPRRRSTAPRLAAADRSGTLSSRTRASSGSFDSSGAAARGAGSPEPLRGELWPGRDRRRFAACVVGRSALAGARSAGNRRRVSALGVGSPRWPPRALHPHARRRPAPHAPRRPVLRAWRRCPAASFWVGAERNEHFADDESPRFSDGAARLLHGRDRGDGRRLRRACVERGRVHGARASRAAL